MEMSSTTTSGRRVAASSIASAPFEASATTSNPGSLSSTWRIPVADDRVIVGDEYPDRRLSHERPVSAGSRTSSSAPAPG